MATKKKTLTPPVLGSLNTVPVGGIENDPLRRVLAQIIAGAPSYGPASKPVLACVSALEDAQQIRWQIADGFQSKMQYEAITQQGARSVLAQGGSPIDDDEAARRLEAARQAIVGGIGDEYRDAFFATYQRFVTNGEGVERTIAKGESDADTFESLKSDDKRSLIDVLKDQELRQDVFGRPLVQTWEVLRRASRAGDVETTRRLAPHAEARGLQIMRMTPDELAKSEVVGVASDDSLSKVRTIAMRVLAFAQTYRAEHRPAWIDAARDAWGVLDEPRRQLFGPSVDYLAPGATTAAAFSVAKWLNWQTLESDAHIRFLSWPVRLAGWSPVTMQDHRPGARPGQLVRANPPPTAGPYRFGAQPGGR
jgi:hypothetical protein